MNLHTTIQIGATISQHRKAMAYLIDHIQVNLGGQQRFLLVTFDNGLPPGIDDHGMPPKHFRHF